MDKYSILFPRSSYPLPLDSCLSLNIIHQPSLLDSTQINNNANTYAENNINGLTKTVYDPIHGHITFNKTMWSIVDTPHFQRLRKLKQLALAYLVYPGANHTRFEHSLGVGFLSNQIISSLLSSQHHLSPEDIFYINSVTMAGLCHDIAHGPFSHLFDSVISDIAPSIKWSHEDFAEKIIDDLIDTNHLNIDSSQIILVKSLIKGDYSSSYTDMPWIYQIVANQTNSIDVDKFDYICRDAYHTGLRSCGIDYHSIYNGTNIINDNICFDIDNELNIISLFKTRYKLHKLIYQKPNVLCLNYMMRDAIKLSKEYFCFEEALSDVNRFISLDDSIFGMIKHFDVSHDDDIRNDPKLQCASKIIRDIEKRDIYRIAGMVLVPKHYEGIEIRLRDILSYDNPKDNSYLFEGDVILTSASIDYGFKDKNPFNSIYFFKQENRDNCFKRNSSMLPDQFKEKYIALICKDNKKFERAERLFNHYINTHFNRKPIEYDTTMNTIGTNNKTKHEFLGNKRLLEY